MNPLEILELLDTLPMLQRSLAALSSSIYSSYYSLKPLVYHKIFKSKPENPNRIQDKKTPRSKPWFIPRFIHNKLSMLRSEEPLTGNQSLGILLLLGLTITCSLLFITSPYIFLIALTINMAFSFLALYTIHSQEKKAYSAKKTQLVSKLDEIFKDELSPKLKKHIARNMILKEDFEDFIKNQLDHATDTEKKSIQEKWKDLMKLKEDNYENPSYYRDDIHDLKELRKNNAFTLRYNNDAYTPGYNKVKKFVAQKEKLITKLDKIFKDELSPKLKKHIARNMILKEDFEDFIKNQLDHATDTEKKSIQEKWKDLIELKKGNYELPEDNSTWPYEEMMEARASYFKSSNLKIRSYTALSKLCLLMIAGAILFTAPTSIAAISMILTITFIALTAITILGRFVNFNKASTALKSPGGRNITLKEKLRAYYDIRNKNIIDIQKYLDSRRQIRRNSSYDMASQYIISGIFQVAVIALATAVALIAIGNPIFSMLVAGIMISGFCMTLVRNIKSAQDEDIKQLKNKINKLNNENELNDKNEPITNLKRKVLKLQIEDLENHNPYKIQLDLAKCTVLTIIYIPVALIRLVIATTCLLSVLPTLFNPKVSESEKLFINILKDAKFIWTKNCPSINKVSKDKVKQINELQEDINILEKINSLDIKDIENIKKDLEDIEKDLEDIDDLEDKQYLKYQKYKKHFVGLNLNAIEMSHVELYFKSKKKLTDMIKGEDIEKIENNVKEFQENIKKLKTQLKQSKSNFVLKIIIMAFIPPILLISTTLFYCIKGLTEAAPLILKNIDKGLSNLVHVRKEGRSPKMRFLLGGLLPITVPLFILSKVLTHEATKTFMSILTHPLNIFAKFLLRFNEKAVDTFSINTKKSTEIAKIKECIEEKGFKLKSLHNSNINDLDELLSQYHPKTIEEKLEEITNQYKLDQVIEKIGGKSPVISSVVMSLFEDSHSSRFETQTRLDNNKSLNNNPLNNNPLDNNSLNNNPLDNNPLNNNPLNNKLPNKPRKRLTTLSRRQSQGSISDSVAKNITSKPSKDDSLNNNPLDNNSLDNNSLNNNPPNRSATPPRRQSQGSISDSVAKNITSKPSKDDSLNNNPLDNNSLDNNSLNNNPPNRSATPPRRQSQGSIRDSVAKKITSKPSKDDSLNDTLETIEPQSSTTKKYGM